jgi:PAS domain S-box-containing protein
VDNGKRVGDAEDGPEERLRNLEERWRLLMEVTSNAIWDFNAADGRVWRNDAYLRMFGPRDEEPTTWLDCRRWWSDRIHPDDRVRVVQSFEQAIASDADGWQAEYRYRQWDGSYALVADRARFSRDAAGRLTRALGAVQDLTTLNTSQTRLAEREFTIRRMFELQERERRLISHDIHDGLAQTLFGALMNIEAAQAKFEDDVGIDLERALELTRKAMRECRRLINDLRPLVIEECGVEEAIRHLIAESMRMAECHFQFECRLQTERFEPLFEGVVFRVAQEAISNSMRHGRAANIRIELVQDGATLSIRIEDDGIGFDPERIPSDRFGVRGIQERARLYRGSAQFTPRPGGGTRLDVRLVIPETS